MIIVGSPDGEARIGAYNAGIEAVFDYADEVEVWLDIDLIQSDHPDIIDSIQSSLDSAGDGQFVGSANEAREALSKLLQLTTIHRVVGLERLVAKRDGRVLLRHVADHNSWTLGPSGNSDIVQHVRDALDDEPAVLLPAETLEIYCADGTKYKFSPPSLCTEGRTCFGLGGIDAIEIDDERREIRLDWGDSGGLLKRTLSVLTPNRPERLQFESESQFREVANAFEPLAEALDQS